MLEIKSIHTGYGPVQIVFGVSMKVEAGRIVSIIGPNGSGKSTILKAVSGVLPVWKGEVWFNGKQIQGMSVI
jgi:branched-chain amino acid transport system ATP-binding protein